MYYFVSDIHLGLNHLNPVERERRFASFLNGLPADTKAVYMLGDIFDFWYEYKNVVPRGFTRVLGAMAALADRGVEVCFFNGNHDIWTYSYLQNEIGVKLLKQPYIVEIEGKRFCLLTVMEMRLGVSVTCAAVLMMQALSCSPSRALRTNRP